MTFSTIKITSKKVRGNNVGFWTIEITPKKIGENNVGFSTIETHREKYVEVPGIFGPSRLHR